jgi:lysophospholipase L1-like esterase
VDLQSPGGAVWSTPLDGPRDMQLVGGDRVAVSIASGYVELDLATGQVKKQVGGFASVESLRRLPGGGTVLGANTGGGVTLQELDGHDAPVRSATFPSYGQLRLLRRTPQGTFLLGVGTKLAEVDWSGRTVWDMEIPGGSSVFQGLRLANGTLAVASGYGAAILIVDPSARTVRTTIGGKAQPDAATVVPNFYAGFQVLPDGRFVVTNWEGHGAGNGGKGLQLLEYDASGRLVWTWKQDPNLVSSLHNVIVLDGLDTTRLHDDVDGVLAPVAAAAYDPCPASGDCRILPLGDSITDGFFPQPGGYRIELFRKARAAGRHVTFVGSQQNGPATVDGVPFPSSHEGHSGWTIDQIAGLVPSPALNATPHLVLLMAGTNDVLHGQPLASAPARLGALLDKILAGCPDALIVVAQLTPLAGDQASKDAAVATYNAALPEVVKARVAQGKHVVLVDMHTGFPPTELADGIHPNPDGYARMAGVWYSAIEAYLH